MHPLSSEECRTLLSIAHHAISEAVGHQRIPDLPALSGRLAEPGAAFVSVYSKGRLRGCIGQTQRNNPLGEVVAQCAISAALQDAQFRPLQTHEIAGIHIEISVLSEFEPSTPAAIETGKHGVLVARGEHRGLLLPQVAERHRMSADRFLSEACRKAGLDAQAWRDPETKLFVFTAELVSDMPPANDLT